MQALMIHCSGTDIPMATASVCHTLPADAVSTKSDERAKR